MRSFPTDQRKRYLAAADQIRDGKPLTEDQLAYLADVFQKIGHGADANEVMGLTYGPGQRAKDEKSLQQRFFVLHWMRWAQVPENILDDEGFDIGGLGLTLEQTIDAVLAIGCDGEWINPKTGERFVYKDDAGNVQSPFPKFTYDTLHAMWRRGQNKHMKELFASVLTPNSPYSYEKIKTVDGQAEGTSDELSEKTPTDPDN